MFCKTIILSNTENSNSNAPKGILTLSKENNSLKGKIRLYNLLTLPPNTKIGLYINEKVIIKDLIKKTNHYEFDLPNNIDISQSIYCALIDQANNKQVLLEGGSFNGFYFSDSPFDAVLEAKDEQLEQTISKAIENENCNTCNCTECEYKKYFYEHYKQEPILNKKTEQSIDDEKFSTQSNSKEVFEQGVIETLNDEVIEEIKSLEQNICAHNDNISKIQEDENTPSNLQQEKLDFLNDIIYQLDEMFTQYPEDEMLNSIIDNSRFIRVDGENPYVVGVIYENKMLKYLAYGVPAQYNSLPPSDFGKHYQWLPLNPKDVMSDGYFLFILQN